MKLKYPTWLTRCFVQNIHAPSPIALFEQFLEKYPEVMLYIRGLMKKNITHNNYCKKFASSKQSVWDFLKTYRTIEHK